MSVSLHAQSNQPKTPNADAIIGAAVFDLSGLPKEYYTTHESHKISWVQTIFQALGLRSLIMSSLQLDGFNHAVIHGEHHCAIVVKQKTRYLALLMRQTDLIDSSQTLLNWMQTFEPSTLKTNPRFSAI